MKLKFLTLLLLVSSIVKAQQVHLQATIVDAQTNQPVPNTFVSIKLKPNSSYWQSDNSDKRFYYRADTMGKFNMVTDKITETDSITVSCFNYKTRVIKLSDVEAGHIIKLMRAVKNPRVNIGQSEPVIISVGSKMQKSGKVCYNVDPGYEDAMFMHGSQDVQGTIKTVGFYVSDGRKSENGDATAPFRIRIFKIDTAAGPGEELTKDVIIVAAKKSNAWFDVDISAYNIENPCDGFYVAISMLDSGYYKIKKGAPTLDAMGQPIEYGADASNIIMPKLGFTEEFEMPRSYFSINRSGENMTRHWIPDYYNRSYMIRATIMPPD